MVKKKRPGGNPAKRENPVRLGQIGPMMVCRECSEPLTLYSLVDKKDEFNEEKIVYVHAREHVNSEAGIAYSLTDEYDHEAVPVEGDPLTANSVCDFCHSPDPKYAFVPRRQVRLDDPSGLRQQLDYSSPWNACSGCLPVVKAKNMSKMLDRAMGSPHSENSTYPETFKRAVRAQIRELYVKYIASNPAGPYEIKIAPKPKAQGSPGSRKGM